MSNLKNDRVLAEIYRTFIKLEGSELGDWWDALYNAMMAAGSAGDDEKAHTLLEWLMEDMNRFFTEFMDELRNDPYSAAELADARIRLPELLEQSYYKDITLDDLPDWMKTQESDKDARLDGLIEKAEWDLSMKAQQAGLTTEDLLDRIKAQL